ncbi:hypothetical protein BLNAU_4666 [Blattamonas nauphoetae]|uniref:SPRY domain-containing protein n=1 Tax=Blattamonas nauphoetae TaxID=2049346 RepID=A0ABQ9Y9S3_9EUKA|nr:hypothetical protein BLNAU_4666 [Blattamonas nauphoetae]
MDLSDPVQDDSTDTTELNALLERLVQLEKTVNEQTVQIEQLTKEAQELQRVSPGVPSTPAGTIQLSKDIPIPPFSTILLFTSTANTYTRDGNKITRSGQRGWSTVLLDCIMSNGIIQVSFKIAGGCSKDLYFGVFDGSQNPKKLSQPLGHGNCDRISACYCSQKGEMYHMNSAEWWRKDHVSSHSGDTIMMEINFLANPRTLHFFVNKKQSSVYFTDIPETLFVGFSSWYPSDTVIVQAIEYVDEPFVIDGSHPYHWT